MDFINAFLTGAADLIDGFGGLLAGAVSAITAVFYTPGASGTAGELTIVGAAMAFALVVGIVYLIFRLVRGLIKQNNRG